MKFNSKFSLNQEVFFIRYIGKWRLMGEDKRIITCVLFDYKYIFYKIKGFCENVEEKNIFSSKKSALVECEKRNKIYLTDQEAKENI